MERENESGDKAEKRASEYVNKLESQETNGIYLFVWRISRPALKATFEPLEILLPAAVDLLFHSNDT